MRTSAFNKADNWEKQKDLAIFAISRLKQLQQIEVSCVDYDSALALARLVQRFDPDKEVREIHVFSYFVRLTRNEAGSFRFSAVTIDHFGAMKQRPKAIDTLVK